jgi:uncharacterized membrane-anchored protein YhcB (DUF1043 family)
MEEKTVTQLLIDEVVKRQASYNEIEIKNNSMKAAKEEMNRCFNEFAEMLKVIQPKERQNLIDACKYSAKTARNYRATENEIAENYVNQKYGI